MPELIAELLNRMRLLFDLQQANEIAHQFSGCLEPDEIARCVTNGLIEKFDCAFARLWLVEPDQTALKLVASSGMYTNLNGFFGRVPMGAFKVGKIAQNRVSFLSNNLPAESWVGDREWAIAHSIHGFAGYPLLVRNRVIGVLAVFSQAALASEFLEVLQTLCSIVAIALDTALRYQKEKQIWQSANQFSVFNHLPLSDQLASVLTSTRLTLVGTERSLTLPFVYVLLQAATIFQDLRCGYCRLIYTDDAVALEAIVSTIESASDNPKYWIQSILGELALTLSCLGGVLQTRVNDNQRSIQVTLKIPYLRDRSSEKISIQCRSPVLQLAFTQLAFQSGLTVWQEADEDTVLLTDDPTRIQSHERVLWIQQSTQPLPKDITARVDLYTTAEQLRQAVEAVVQSQSWGMETSKTQQIFSERELEILKLLTQGHRDRDIANRLIISESTVKFHMNNILTKLKARTRYQAIHQAIVEGWI